jgi:hypothetical protein
VKKALLKLLEAQLDKHLDREQHRCLQAGAKPSVKKIAYEHFDWLILFQVKGDSYATIAKANHRTVQAVDEGIKKAAEALIGERWKEWLRPTKRGRPRKP